MRRHNAAGTFLLLGIAAIAFGPKSWDAIMGEPFVMSSVSILETSAGSVLVQEETRTPGPIAGVRSNTLENEQGEILCAREQVNSWQGDLKKSWHLPAFVGCGEPVGLYRVCSLFAVQSPSGRSGMFGPFCSGYKAPKTE